MRTVAFFNNKGGVGKTTLVYHLAWMFAELGTRVVAADLDPQANLTAMSLPVDTLAAIENNELDSVYDVIAPVISGEALVAPTVHEVTPGFGLLLGDLELSFVEDALSTGWASRASESPLPPSGWPIGSMTPLGYVISRFTIYKGDKARHFRQWINRVPEVFHREVLRDDTEIPASVEQDSAALAWLKDYHSLMAMAQESRKPIFHLKPSDGAIGGHQQAVLLAYKDFKTLAETIAGRMGLVIAS